MYDLDGFLPCRLFRGHFWHLALLPHPARSCGQMRHDVRVTQCAITLHPIHFREFDAVFPRGGGHSQGGGGGLQALRGRRRREPIEQNCQGHDCCKFSVLNYRLIVLFLYLFNSLRDRWLPQSLFSPHGARNWTAIGPAAWHSRELDLIIQLAVGSFQCTCDQSHRSLFVPTLLSRLDGN